MGFSLAFLVPVFAGGLLSLLIEALQVFLPSRAPGIADIFGNAMGSGAGALIACGAKRGFPMKLGFKVKS